MRFNSSLYQISLPSPYLTYQKSILYLYRALGKLLVKREAMRGSFLLNGHLLVILVCLLPVNSFLIPTTRVTRRATISMAATVDPPTKTSSSASAAVDPSRKMEIVQVELGDRSYPIYIGPGLLKESSLLTQHISGKRSLIITNDVSSWGRWWERRMDDLMGRA